MRFCLTKNKKSCILIMEAAVAASTGNIKKMYRTDSKFYIETHIGIIAGWVEMYPCVDTLQNPAGSLM